MPKRRGYFTFVLHSHLPYVLGHGGWPHGTDWLYEATAETYLPLLRVLAALTDEGIKPKITIGISPVLAEQLADAAFGPGFLGYVEMKIRAARDDRAEFEATGQADHAALAAAWERTYTDVRDDFERRWRGDVVGAFRALEQAGAIEIITCAATHAYLPLVGREETIGLQLRAARASHRRHFGVEPRGIWLPECAYRPAYEWRYPLAPWSERPPARRPGLEDDLARAGLRYFFVDTHLLEGGKALGVYAARFGALQRLYDQMRAGMDRAAAATPRTTYRPHYVGGAEPGVACFGRDPETGLVVWSGEHGYPGDGWYLDFHKKHFPGGLRYWRVTAPQSDLGAKAVYVPARVPGRVAENADHFVGVVRRRLEAAPTAAPILVAPYDAELFGHWWHEGLTWLGEVLRRFAAGGEVELVTAGEYLDRYPPDDVVALPEGSWGEGGFHAVWLNAQTEWSWRLIYETEDRLAAAAAAAPSPLGDRLLRQALREFLLLVASDWQFLITTWSARDYAENRLAYHYDAASRLLNLHANLAARGALDEKDLRYLEELERVDRPFADLEPAWFAAP
jgi:1,4-alpha-glucan branching enzyme